MDDYYSQSKVAYETSPKEVNHKRGLNNGDKQFGNADKMPQENKGYKQKEYKANPVGLDLGNRKYKEHR